MRALFSFKNSLTCFFLFFETLCVLKIFYVYIRKISHRPIHTYFFLFPILCMYIVVSLSCLLRGRFHVFDLYNTYFWLRDHCNDGMKITSYLYILYFSKQVLIVELYSFFYIIICVKLKCVLGYQGRAGVLHDQEVYDL